DGDGPLAARARRALRNDPVGDRAARARRPASSDRHAAPHRGSASVRPRRRARPPQLSDRIVVAVAGDSISAGSPLWNPAQAVRARIASPDERSQWQFWASRGDPRLEFRTTAVYGERTDEIARRLDLVLPGADVLVVQGGINDVVQQRPADEAARNLGAMLD